MLFNLSRDQYFLQILYKIVIRDNERKDFVLIYCSLNIVNTFITLCVPTWFFMQLYNYVHNTTIES